MLTDEVPNRYTVLNTLILVMGPIITTVVTSLLARNKLMKVEKKADTAIEETRTGNNKLEEVHKTVNGRTDTLIAEKESLVQQLQEAKIELAKAQTVIAQRRSTD